MNTFPFRPLLVLFYSLNKYAQSMRINKKSNFSLLQTDSLCFPSMSFTALSQKCPAHVRELLSPTPLSWHMIMAVMNVSYRDIRRFAGVVSAFSSLLLEVVLCCSAALAAADLSASCTLSSSSS